MSRNLNKSTPNQPNSDFNSHWVPHTSGLALNKAKLSK